MLDILNVAQTGLQTSKVQVENVMNNLANENTEGYKKRVVDTSELEHADSRLTGRGVIVDGVSRITNVYMYQNLVEEEAKLNSLAELDVMLNDIESIFQETDDSGLSADLNRYFQSLENLRTSPQNEIYKDDLKNNASILVDDLKNLYIDIEARETGTLNRASDTVEEINNILDSIGQVSQEIMDSVGVPNDLYDKRDSLERELSKYIDVEISREDSYELKIGGKTAVRFDTNVHSLNLVEEYIPQADKYIIDGSLPYESSLVDPTTWNGAANAIEEQTVTLSGTATAQVSFLGTLVAGADGTAGHQTPAEIASDIVADIVNIRAKWNDENPEREIADITAVGDILTITYAALEGDVPNLPVAQSNGIDFIKNTEITKGSVDSISYILNNDITITVTHGETVTNVPIGTNPETYEDIVVDENNIVRALVAKINNNSSIDGEIVAYNGAYELDKDGNKVLTNNPDHSDYDVVEPNKDRYLIIESTVDGEKGKFLGEMLVIDNENKSLLDKNNDLSVEGTDDIRLEIFEEEVFVTGGMLAPMIDNIKTESGSNSFTQYKEKLDLFAKTLSDLSASYIENIDETYVYGENASSIHQDSAEKIDIGLFTGGTVESLTFYSSMVNTLSQEKLDYLASIQWKDDIDFDGTGENNTSFSKFYQTLRVDIADDRETIIFKKESQTAVTEAMNTTYDKLTKVDKDTEMVELIKFQAAYEANAKMITIVDEMLQTILGMKR